MPDTTVDTGDVKVEMKGYNSVGIFYFLSALFACAELVGTFFLILLCVGSANTRSLEDLADNKAAYFISISLAFGLGIGGIVHICSSSSGGNVNPAVSLALFLDKRISFIKMIVYWIFQFAGGFAGAGLIWALGYWERTTVLTTIVGTNAVSGDINNAQAFFLEAFGTMYLILTILSTINEARGHAPSYLQPFSIGIAIAVLHIFLIPYTNCAINPVRGTVWNVVSGEAEVETLIFLFAPCVGAIFAVPFHNLFFA